MLVPLGSGPPDLLLGRPGKFEETGARRGIMISIIMMMIMIIVIIIMIITTYINTW